MIVDDDGLSSWPDVPPPAVVQQVINLLQVYGRWTDAGRTDDLATLFTSDAEWDGRELGFGHAAGPQAIAELVTAHADPTRPMMHMTGPPLLMALSPTEVRAVTWCQATRCVDGRTTPVIYFSYDDVIRGGEEGWRFARRHLNRHFDI